MKVVNIGNIAEAYICDDLPAMGVVIEATLDELERLPNLIYKEVTISATLRRNCDMYANYIDAMKAFEAFVREQGKLGFINPYTEAFKWLFAHATEKEGGAK